MDFMWFNDLFKFLASPVPGVPVQQIVTTASPLHMCDKCNLEMRLVGHRVHSANRMVQNTWQCPKCYNTRVENALMRVIP